MRVIRRPAPTWELIIALIAALVVLIVAVQIAAEELVIRSGGRSLVGLDRTKAVDDARTSIAQLVAGIGLLGALGYTARTYALSRATQWAERFLTAAEQLANEFESVRLSAIFSLTTIARQHSEYWPVVDQILCAFIRERATSRRVSAEVQTALRVIGGGKGKRPQRKEGKSAQILDLRGVTLSGAVLTDLVLDRARLDGAVLEQADLTDASLRGAVLVGIKAPQAQLVNAKIQGADFTSANLRLANFRQAVFEDTEIGDADLWEAENLTNEQLKGATGKAKRKPSATPLVTSPTIGAS